MDAPGDDVVSSQYERWVYPAPIEDLPAWLADSWQWFDPSHAHRLLWPDRDYAAGMDILVAGCGTSQAAVIAYNNPAAHVVAIDVSRTSLDHHETLKERYGLGNLELHLLPIEEAASLGQDFDLVVSTGVLHHLADPRVGMQALADRLRPDGVIALMLYARYGRVGVELLEGVFRDLGLGQDEASIAMVREALAVLPDHHPLHGYLAIAPDLGYDAGLVDTFLHGRQRSYTVGDCLDLVESAGLVFQDWFLKSPYEPFRAPGNGFLTAVAALPDAQRWSVMERIATSNGCHFFTACRRDRPVSTYRIDIDGPDAMQLVPVMRYRCGVDGSDVVRPGWRWPLDDARRAIARAVDGRRTIKQIADVTRAAAPQAATGATDHDTDHCTDHDTVVREWIGDLWRRDFVALTIAPR